MDQEHFRAVRIMYTNHRHETEWRNILPVRLFWSEDNRYHPEPQYLLAAWDLDKKAGRDFAMNNIQKWENARTTVE